MVKIVECPRDAGQGLPKNMPVKTREVLMVALEAASLNPEVPRFNPGVLQT
jgi:hypothetical protein